MSARATLLQSIRTANGGTTSLADASSAWHTIDRPYRQQGGGGRDAVVEHFVERVRDYDATIVRTSVALLPQAVKETLAVARTKRLLIPLGMDAVDLEALRHSGLEIVLDRGLSAPELDRVDTVLTTSTLSIAETGTIVLQSTAGQGRRALSLIPDTHLCLVRASDIVATVPEGVKRLASTATLPTTFISGPSATADIEMTRIKGVHGPRFLYVLLLEDC
jgi:L-lactate dehydrogenase complex protein LldG